ncbi:thiamine pyrophosphate-binding protein, partial [Salmonella enterica subsp. enterica serovar Virginia]|nr:thiamine pyrophosphate-binding protein [Salmonella enterica subsp. enterica serovar Virginia]
MKRFYCIPRCKLTFDGQHITFCSLKNTAFGVPGAAINPFYSAMRKHGGIRHILARHVEGASHMAEGYT